MRLLLVCFGVSFIGGFTVLDSCTTWLNNYNYGLSHIVVYVGVVKTVMLSMFIIIIIMSFELSPSLTPHVYAPPY